MHDNMNKSIPRVAVVTGGNKGIGLAITEKLLACDYKVIVGARSSLPDTLIDNENVIFMKGDVAIPQFHQDLAGAAMSEFQALDLYINNAGFSQWKSIKGIEPEFLNNIFATNLFSAFWGCKAALRFLKPGSCIVNVSSIAGKRGSACNSAYVATKFAMNGLTQSLAKELGPIGIRVNAVCPVLVKTEGLVQALAAEDSPASGEPLQFIDTFKDSQTALNRLPTGIEVADLVAYLASSSATAITGQCINVDCGVFPQ